LASTSLFFRCCGYYLNSGLESSLQAIHSCFDRSKTGSLTTCAFPKFQTPILLLFSLSDFNASNPL
ncbi:MAG: hypothetical protein RI556_05890, partial [Hydrogenovibrio sp.]|uniref:hypothetical protein n=1 Tax=Hydrogenovibrio sp. TaxID=2065821 RepID=UPI002870999F